MREIREKIFELADQKYKEFHSGLCPNANNIIGVRVPDLRNLAKTIAKEDWRNYLANAENKYYEEILLQGMVIGLAKMEIQERLKYVKEFVPKIDNWAVCDISCGGFKFAKKEPEIVWNFIQNYLKSEHEFEIRFCIVMMLDHYIDQEHISKILEILENVHHEGYYVKMAVAWAISIAYIKFPKETMNVLKHSKLDDFTYNKALQKIIESYRVSKEEKIIIRNMKK